MTSRIVVSVGWLMLSTSLFVAGCSGQQVLALMPGVVNDPKNRTLRREILRMGSGEFCRELTKRGTPIRLRDDDPVIGRFFARQCDWRDVENGDAFVQVSGFGYGWTAPTARLGFQAGGAIQYNQDFLLNGSTMYAYFRPRSVRSTEFRTQMVERVQASPLGAIASGPVQPIADRLGAQLVGQELARGFTVLRREDGSVDFGLGIVEVGQQPRHPFQVRGEGRITLANERTEVQGEERDFLGPFDVQDEGRALYVTMTLDGAAAVDMLLFRRDAVDVWLNDYVTRSGVTPPPGPALAADVVSSRGEWKRTYAVPKGLYMLVIDHTSSAGPTTPMPGPAGLLGPTIVPASVSYIVQLGDAP